MTAAIYLAIILAVCAVLYYARKGGQDSEKAAEGETNAKSAEKVADAVGAAPGSLSAVREHVRDGGKL